jgi:hypothetical protein
MAEASQGFTRAGICFAAALQVLALLAHAT